MDRAEAMSEDEWANTPPVDAVATFIIFMMSIVKLAVGNALGGDATRQINEFFSGRLEPLLEAQLVDRPELASFAERVRGLFDSDRDDSVRNVLMIIAAISAFEACFEDFCKGILQMQPTIVDDKDIPKPKFTFSQFLSTAEDDKRDVVYESIEAAGVFPVNESDRF